MATAIPLTTTTDLYTSPGAAVFDFGGTPFQAGYLYVQNASAYVSMRVGNSLGQSDWQVELPYSPTLIPLLAGDATPWRRNTGPDLIYGVRARSLVAGTPAVVYGGAFQPGEATSLPSNQLTGTVSPSGAITPGTALINGITGLVGRLGTVVAGTGYTVGPYTPGSGMYAINYTTPFTSTPDLWMTPKQGDVTYPVYQILGESAAGFTVQFVEATSVGTGQNCTFSFGAVAVQ